MYHDVLWKCVLHIYKYITVIEPRIDDAFCRYISQTIYQKTSIVSKQAVEETILIGVTKKKNVPIHSSLRLLIHTF